jgi:hypothetical protein
MGCCLIPSAAPEVYASVSPQNWPYIQIVDLVNPSGSVGLIGVYFDEDPGGVDKNAKKASFCSTHAPDLCVTLAK